VSYQYLNLPVAFSGPVNFQGFGINIVLRVDHLTVVALAVVELCVIGALGWHRFMGRVEPGAARFHALVSLFLFACTGVLVSYDLAELLAFWGLAGVATYLLLAHRWSVDSAARTTRIALAASFPHRPRSSLRRRGGLFALRGVEPRQAYPDPPPHGGGDGQGARGGRGALVRGRGRQACAVALPVLGDTHVN